MKKKTLVLCELCSDDTLAQTIVHWGLCGSHVAQIVPDAVPKVRRKAQSPRKHKKPSRVASKPRKGFRTMLHKKCDRQIDLRGWKAHVRACRGKEKQMTA